jgi:cystathionine beta-lyase/cystathionine gamma-synthase
MKLESKAVHSGDRRKPAGPTPVTTPIHTATTYFYDTTEQLDRVFGREEAGFSYSRYDNPTNSALEELVASLENGAGALACSSGMAALHIGLTAALMDRRKSVVSASAMYGATISLLQQVLEPFGVEVTFVDICDLERVERAISDARPGAVVMETVSNPLLRVGAIDRIAEMARAAGAAVIVDNTFATPMMARPLELGANMVVHSVTKYLAGHGDVLGGAVVCDAEHLDSVRTLARIYGPLLGPFEAYLTMRGIKSFPVRFERQCRNACRLASWLAAHPGVEKTYYLADPNHPDAATIKRLFPPDLNGAMVSFELKGVTRREDVFAFMDRLKMIVRATSLGDVHTMVLYPAMASHREIAPKQRDRMGIRDNLLRLSVGIEAVDDIIADLEQALSDTDSSDHPA